GRSFTCPPASALGPRAEYEIGRPGGERSSAAGVVVGEHAMAAETRPENLTFILDRIAKRIEDDGPEANSRDITLGDILDIVGRQAYGPLLLIIGVMSVSPLALLPGSTWAFALLTLLVAAQMAFNLKHPWLPRSALRLSFPEDKVASAIDKVRPWTAAVDKVVKPRMEFL